jgi:hypothetical protein
MSKDNSSNEIKITKEQHIQFLKAVSDNKRQSEIAKRARIKRQAKINLLLQKAIKSGITVTDSEVSEEIKRLNSK